MTEQCLLHGLTKAETQAALAGFRVHPKITEIVWHRLELENPEYFAAYYAALRAKTLKS